MKQGSVVLADERTGMNKMIAYNKSNLAAVVLRKKEFTQFYAGSQAPA